MLAYTITHQTAKEYVKRFKANQKGALKVWNASKKVPPSKNDFSNTPISLTMNAFTFSIEEIKILVSRVNAYNKTNSKKANAIRFYTGIKENRFAGIVPGAPKLIPCLVFVPVTGFVKGELSPQGKYTPPKGGTDLSSIPSATTGLQSRGTMARDASEDDSAYYDFTFPCPDTCPDNPL